MFPPVGFSMQAHVFFRDTWHHPYISSCFCVMHNINVAKSAVVPWDHISVVGCPQRVNPLRHSSDSDDLVSGCLYPPVFRERRR